MSNLMVIVHTPDRNPDAYVLNETWDIEDTTRVPVKAYFTLATDTGVRVTSATEGSGVTVSTDPKAISVVLTNTQVAVPESTDVYWELQVLWADNVLETFKRGHAVIMRAL